MIGIVGDASAECMVYSGIFRLLFNLHLGIFVSKCCSLFPHQHLSMITSDAKFSLFIPKNQQQSLENRSQKIADSRRFEALLQHQPLPCHHRQWPQLPSAEPLQSGPRRARAGAGRAGHGGGRGGVGGHGQGDPQSWGIFHVLRGVWMGCVLDFFRESLMCFCFIVVFWSMYL